MILFSFFCFLFPLLYFHQQFCLFQLHRASANIIEPTGESDNPLRFTSGLVVALDVDATLEHVQDPQGTVKVQVSSRLTIADKILFWGEFSWGHEDVNTSWLQTVVLLNTLGLLWCNLTCKTVLHIVPWAHFCCSWEFEPFESILCSVCATLLSHVCPAHYGQTQGWTSTSLYIGKRSKRRCSEHHRSWYAFGSLYLTLSFLPAVESLLSTKLQLRRVWCDSSKYPDALLSRETRSLTV